MHLISLFLTSILTENVILTKFLGMCPFVGVSNKEKKAFGMGINLPCLSSYFGSYPYRILTSNNVYFNYCDLCTNFRIGFKKEVSKVREIFRDLFTAYYDELCGFRNCSFEHIKFLYLFRNAYV